MWGPYNALSGAASMIVRVLGEEVPYARWLLRILRDKATSVERFRWALRKAGTLLAMEASEELEWRSLYITTPLEARARELEPVAEPLIVGVLGASLPMVEGVLDAYPSAPLALIAARRIEEGEAVRVEVSYERLPASWRGPVMIVDPMLATGLTISSVAEKLQGIGATRVIALTCIAAPEGIRRLAETSPNTVLYTLAIDRGLNDRFFIVPGLGDAGDRGLGVTPA